jgi:hypothetical protein
MDEHDLFLQQGLKNSLKADTYEKCYLLVISRMKHMDLTPFQFYTLWLFIIEDLHRGQDGYNGSLIEQHNISITLKEMIDFAKYYKGEQYSEEVRKVCNKMNHQEKDFRFMDKEEVE